MLPLFVQCCADLTSLAGLPRKDVSTDEHGLISLEFELDGVRVELICESEGSPRFFSRIVLGKTNECGQRQFWSDLLDCNFQTASTAGPFFARDPSSGEVVVQHAWPAGVDAQTLLESISAFARLGDDWTSGRLPAEANMDAESFMQSESRDDTEELTAHEVRFHQLCHDLQEEFGNSELGIERFSGLTSFVVDVADIQMQVCHFSHHPEWLHLFGHVGAADETSPFDPEALAEFNAWMFAEPHGGVICRRALTCDYALHAAIALQDDGADALLDMFDELTAAIRSVRQHLAAAPMRTGEAIPFGSSIV